MTNCSHKEVLGTTQTHSSVDKLLLLNFSENLENPS